MTETVKALVRQSRGQFLRGDGNRALRASIMPKVLGRKPKPSECGVNYVTNQLLEFSGIDQSACRAVTVDSLITRSKR